MSGSRGVVHRLPSPDQSCRIAGERANRASFPWTRWTRSRPHPPPRSRRVHSRAVPRRPTRRRLRPHRPPRRRARHRRRDASLHRAAGARTGPCWRSRSTTPTPPSRSSGLKSADIVYVEQVEGGLSRVMAVFSSKLPVAGRPGAQRPHLRPAPAAAVRQAGVRVLRRAGQDEAVRREGAADRRLAGPQHTGYARAGSNPAPYNLFASPKKAAGPGAQGEPGPRHRVPLRAGARGRQAGEELHGAIPRGVVRVPLVGPRQALAGHPGRAGGPGGGGRDRSAAPTIVVQ